jgi:hypothetical protein
VTAPNFRRFTCNVAYEAPGAVQIRWTRDNAAVTAWNDLPGVGAPCPAGSQVDVSVTVSGASGTAPPASGSVYCPEPEPPCNPICPIEPLVDGPDGLAGRREGIY